MEDLKEAALRKLCLGEALLLCCLLPHLSYLVLVALVVVSSAWHGVYLQPSSEAVRKYLHRMKSPPWKMTGMLGVLFSASYVSSLFSPMVEVLSPALSSARHTSGAICKIHHLCNYVYGFYEFFSAIVPVIYNFQLIKNTGNHQSFLLFIGK